ncbi:hypothetical protein J1614_007379 [Plenodomus biglobosus]|nr:hypothetical protein J1614_007379 [Plenodomus biglobosus]
MAWIDAGVLFDNGFDMGRLGEWSLDPMNWEIHAGDGRRDQSSPAWEWTLASGALTRRYNFVLRSQYDGELFHTPTLRNIGSVHTCCSRLLAMAGSRFTPAAPWKSDAVSRGWNRCDRET